ncbi:MAG: LysM peptidoglycan-binding domain-containing protein [Nitrospirae bacterium]|nr:LysM peptidoglycan-binding domain-containing protein [Nitrospirota bacterium]
MRWLRALSVAALLSLLAPGAAWPLDLEPAHQARQAADYPAAIALYRAAGDQPDALFWLGTVLRWNGDPDGAGEAFQRLLRMVPDHADGLLGDARVALAQGLPARAEADLTRLLAARPDDAEARALLFTAYLRQHKPRAAYHWADRAFAGDEALRRKAEAAEALMWYRREATHLNELLSRHPDDAGLVLALGRAYERMGYLGDAARLYRSNLERFPEHTDLALRLGVVYRALHERDLAASQFERVLERVADHPEALLARAYVEMDRDNLGTGRALPVAEPAGDVAPAATEPAAAPPVDAPTAAAMAETPAVPRADARPTAADAPRWLTAPVRVVRHAVAPGDTLGTVASRYLGDPALWAYVRNANPELDNPHRLTVGQLLRVPIPPVLAGSGASRVRHVVAPGDTLGTIAGTYLGDATLWPLVRRANPDMADPNRIAPGQTLWVPAVAAPAAPVVASEAPESGELPLKTDEKSAPAPATHTVLAGESLSLIALRELGATDRWRAILAANPHITDPDRIHPGQVLVLPRAPGAVPPIPAEPGAVAEVAAGADTGSAPGAARAAPAMGDTSAWGARHWLARLLADDPGHFDGRLALARLTLRDMDFADAEARFRDLHRERPGDCAPCGGWIAAREQRRPVLDATFSYAVSHDLDGRSDRIVTPAPVRYRTLGWHLGARDRVSRALTLATWVDFADSSLVNRVTGVPVYDFDALTGWVAATRHLGDRHTVSLALGATRYRPNDANSIADRDFGRARLAWDRVAWNRESHLSLAQGPFLGRGLATQQAFRLFRERRLGGERGAQVAPDLWLRGSAAVSDYSDGHTIADLALEAEKRAGDHHLTARAALDHRLGRFLDEGGADLALVFVPTRELRVADRWARPFPFRFEVSGLVRAYAANTFTQLGANPGDPPLARVSPANRELAFAAEAAYAHPALAPLAFGIRFDAVNFLKDAYAYDTVTGAGPTLFLELADRDRPCWEYLLRYEWGVRWDEDPASDHYGRHLVRGRVARAAGRHLSAALDARYGVAPAFAERDVRVAGTLEWRF